MIFDNCNVDKGCAKMRSRELLVNTINFNDTNLEEFLNISEKIERVTRERRSQRKRSNSIVSTKTRREIFQSINKDDNKVLTALEPQISYEDDIDDRASLITSIDNLITYFGEDMEAVNDGFGKPLPIKKNPKGKVAWALASIQNKRNMAVSSLSKYKEQQPVFNVNVNELRRKYETLIETKVPSPKMVGVRSLEFSSEISVKQLVVFFNNKSNQVIRNTSSELRTPQPVSPSLESVASPNFTSTPKLKTKTPNFVFRIPSPMPNPFFREKRLQKSPDIISLTDSLVGKQEQLEIQSSTTCLVDKLSVKDKILFYNEFIEDVSKKNSNICGSKIPNIKKEVHCRGEVIFETQGPVNYVRDMWEKRFLPSENRSETLQRFKRPPLSDITHKYKENKENIQTNISTLPLSEKVLDLKKSNSKLKDGGKKDEKAFDTNASKTSLKRTQSMIRSSFPVEPYAPPKKIRKRIGDEYLAPKMFFQNKNLEDLFYHWLKEKNDMEFDMKLINNKGDIEIVPKNRDNIILPNEIKKISKAFANEFEKNVENNTGVTKDNNIVLINNTLSDKSILKESVIEVELPLEVKTNTAESQKSGTEDSDLGLASITKTTSEESNPKLKPKKISDPTCKKKLHKTVMLKSNIYILEPKAIFLANSDSEFKYRRTNIRNYTFPKLKNCSNYVKMLIFNALNNNSPSSKQNKHIKCKSGVYNIYLGRYLEKKVNSPSKIKKAYTLTVMSSPSPYSQSESNDRGLSKTSKKELTKLCSNLPDIKIDGYINSTKSIDLKGEQKKMFTENSIDQGFETGSNDTESTLRLPTLNSSNFENSLDTNKSFIKQENPKNFSTPNKDKPIKEAFGVEMGLTDHNIIISPISRNCSIQKSPASPTMAVMEDSKELQKKESNGANLNLANTKTDNQLELETKLTVPEMLKNLQNLRKIKLKSLQQRMLYYIDVDPQIFKDINDPPEYIRKLNNIISAVDRIGRGSGFDTCTMDQLESFAFLLNRYGDVCLTNCIDLIEKILDAIVKIK